MGAELSKASFGAGCFWGVEAAFRRLAGVKSTQVGYMGGTTKNPTYEDVCTDTTGHAEVVEITYDPQVLSYHDLLEVFWDNHNPDHAQPAGSGRRARSIARPFFTIRRSNWWKRALRAKRRKRGSPSRL